MREFKNGFIFIDDEGNTLLVRGCKKWLFLELYKLTKDSYYKNNLDFNDFYEYLNGQYGIKLYRIETVSE